MVFTCLGVKVFGYNSLPLHLKSDNVLIAKKGWFSCSGRQPVNPDCLCIFYNGDFFGAQAVKFVNQLVDLFF